jgi:type I restriction enzyme R subunit
MIRDDFSVNLGIEDEDFDYAPFAREGGLGKAYRLYWRWLKGIIEQLNEALAA